MLTRIHAIAGTIGLLTILCFWLTTAVVELGGGIEAIAAVKRGILWGMIVLIPAMAAVGGSGFRLAGSRGGGLVGAKKKRMPFIAVNGLLVLLPSAVYLNHLASAGDFGTAFYGVQTIELLAGAANITLMALNMRDGLRLTGRLGQKRAA
jgi:hypothetical protein